MADEYCGYPTGRLQRMNIMHRSTPQRSKYAKRNRCLTWPDGGCLQVLQS